MNSDDTFGLGPHVVLINMHDHYPVHCILASRNSVKKSVFQVILQKMATFHGDGDSVIVLSK